MAFSALTALIMGGRVLRVGELFAGIGGFTKGLENTGHFETVFFVEKEPFCQQVLKKHWPDVEIYSDVTNFKYKSHVDLVTAGFPCQDISYAGEGAGLSGERSGLFWYIIRTLCMVGRPNLLLENVAALLNRGMGTVLGSLAQIGYDAEWHCIPASYVGAWHRRDRVWIFANPEQQRGRKGFPKEPILRQSHLSQPLKGIFEKWPGRSNLPTPTLCTANNGISKELDALGNAVVPAIPEIIGHAIIEAMND